MNKTLTPSVQVRTVDELVEAVRAGDRLCVRGGGSKPALVRSQDVTLLDMSQLSGVLEYDPGEYTITARAGTPLSEVHAALADNGQYLPFDPPLAAAGATVGGTVAAGLSGPGRYRYGGVRDFLIGVRFVDGQGRLIRGGGKVVKNAAGFDLPKLLTGSLGALGVLTETTFKVFPQPRSHATLIAHFDRLADAVAAMGQLATAPFEFDSVDLAPVAPDNDSGKPALLIRMGGLADLLQERLNAVARHLAHISALDDAQIARVEDDAELWRTIADFGWAEPNGLLAKAPLTLSRIGDFWERAQALGASCHFSVGGNVAWISTSQTASELDQALLELGLPGLVIWGDVAGSPQIGVHPGRPFAERIKQTLDPHGIFPDL